jgi:ferredoxin
MVKIDKKKCIGCGTCVSICPQVFELKGDKASVKKGQEKSSLPCVKEAIESCPESAISD